MGAPLSCREVEPLLDAFADGELEASDTVWVESHLAGCADCVERLRFASATKASIRRVFANDPEELSIPDDELPDGFLSRMESALSAEESRAGDRADDKAAEDTRAWWQRWEGVAPVLAVAAGFLFWVNFQPSVTLTEPKAASPKREGSVQPAQSNQVSLIADPGPVDAPDVEGAEAALADGRFAEPDLVDEDASETERAAQESRATVRAVESRRLLDPALDRLIDYHTSPPQPQVTEARLLPAFEPTVGVRLRLPSLARAKWQGANLVPVVNHQAASLRYQMPGRRQVTVWVFDPRKVSLREPLNKHVVEGNPIYVGEWRGYSVAAKENRGIGYAMAADLDAKALTQLITSIH